MYYWTMLLLLFGLALGTETTWQKPGCHKIERMPSRTVEILDKFYRAVCFILEFVYQTECIIGCSKGIKALISCKFDSCHTRKIRIPDCVEFSVTTNACRGYCQSWSLPSIMLGINRHPITSFGQCCNIMESEDKGLYPQAIREALFKQRSQAGGRSTQWRAMIKKVPVKVLCLDGERNLNFKSATSCACYHCKKD